MKAKYIKLNLIVVMLLLFATLITLFGGVGVTYAAETNYSNVLADLRKDSDFKISDYPAIADDYSLQVIQIAESTGGELFVYVYQPAAKERFLKATQVNMSLTDKMGGIVTDETELKDKDKPKLYNLTFLNGAGVFQKYRVDGLKIAADEVRYYNIVSIFRDWIKGIDEETDNDNTYNSVYFSVKKLYKAETIDNIVKYSCVATDSVEIFEPYVDFVSYYDGLDWASVLFMTEKYSDIHYIAFSTDKKIETLREADITYRTRSYTTGRGTTYGELSEPQYKTLTGEKDISTKNGRYTWKSIMTTSDFIKSTKLNDVTKKEVEKYEFVLVFLSTPYSQRSAGDLVGHYTKKEGTKVSNVSILRLEFEKDGIVYNLGAVMNQLEGDDTPGNQEKPLGFWAYVWRCIYRLFKGTATLVEQIVAVVAIFICLMFLPLLLLIISLCSPVFAVVMKSVLKVIGKVLLWLLKGIWWVVCLPFKGIAALIHKRRGE